MMSENDFSVVIESPGRVNFIGGHVDYNGGYVLPAAINKKITLKFKKNNTNTCSVYSKNFKSQFTIDLNNVERSDIEWRNYLLGVIYHINVLKPNCIQGFDCEIESDLPVGSGVSSSAALECGFAKGIDELFSLGLTDIEMIKLSRDAEHTFVGTKCGIMDQFAVVKGKKNHLIYLNCETLEYNHIKADFKDYDVVLLNTNVSHNLASSEYNVRVNECNSALEAIQTKYPKIQFLANTTPEIVTEFKKILPEKVYNRALFIAEENQRTLNAVKALENENMVEFGRLIYQTHEGLTTLYEVSCKELDFLIDLTHDLKYVIGARMMGGGFGGCTINLVHRDFSSEFIELAEGAYQEQFDIELTSISLAIGNGVTRIK